MLENRHDLIAEAIATLAEGAADIEPALGWLTTIGRIHIVKPRGLANVDGLFVFASAAFNLIRLPKLLATAGMGWATCPHAHAAVHPGAEQRLHALVHPSDSMP